MQTEWSAEWILDGPHTRARDLLQRSLKAQNLEICFELDLSADIQRRAGVRLSKTTVFGVACPFLLLEALVTGSDSALLFPVHIVLAEHRDSILVSILSSPAVRTSGLSPAISIPLHKTLVRLALAIESAGAHRSCEHGRVPAEDGPHEFEMEEAPAR